MGVEELFDLMETTPIHFGNQDDFNGFLSLIYSDYQERWFHAADVWEWSLNHSCLGINKFNKQISHLYLDSFKNTPFEFCDVKHIFSRSESYIRVDDLL